MHLCAPQVNDLLNWRRLSQKTRSPKALRLIACGQWLLSDSISRCLRRSLRQVGFMSWRCRVLPGLAAARGRDGQHGEARDSPGTLDEPTPSDYATLQSSHVESSTFHENRWMRACLQGKDLSVITVAEWTSTELCCNYLWSSSKLVLSHSGRRWLHTCK